jgi:hypothetical protein
MNIPNYPVIATFQRKITFFFDDGTDASEFKTIKQMTNRPRKGNIQGQTLIEWQEHNPSIIKMTFNDNPVLVDANDPHEVSVFKIANLTA